MRIYLWGDTSERVSQGQICYCCVTQKRPGGEASFLLRPREEDPGEIRVREDNTK